VNIKEILGIEPPTEVSTRFQFISPKRGQACTDPRGKPGTCSYIFDLQCGRVLTAIQRLGLTRSVINFLLKAIESPCGFEKFDFTLCCEDANRPSTTTRRPVSFPTRSTTTKATSTTRRTTTTSKPSIKCGMSGQSSTRIVNGQAAKVGAWPWATILGRRSSSRGIIVNCGGTLIHEEYVLSAAHCFKTSGKAGIARFGDLDIRTSNEGAQHEDIDIQRVILHPEYNSTTLKNDIALVKLSRPVTYRFGVGPACLPDQDDKFVPNSPSDPLANLESKPFIIGWGSTGSNEPTEPVLRQAEVPLVDISTCKQNYQPVRNIDIGKTQICAGLGNKDTCSGDSGGPMLTNQLKGGIDTWFVIGITSFGVKCADPEFPGVYTRVDQYLDWINQAIQS